MTAAQPATDTHMPIAIVGIGCRFPGGVRDVASFWRLLIDGVDAITEIPPSRFDIDAYYDPKPGTRGRIMTRWGGFVDQRLEEFDATFFGVSRSYAERLDPQQRLLLETSWEAMEDAGVDIVGLQGTPTGIFVGQWVSDFEHRLFDDTSGIDFQMAMGSGRYAAAGRLSYAFGFRGPSLSIDAACSSGLASVHLAVRSLRSGDSKVALAGGVNMILQPHIHLAYSYSRMMAPDGRCRFGDASGAGYVRAEGAGMVVLKPLDDALADGDRVYAVIRGSAVNNDGNSSGSMGRPSRIGQEELIRSALRDGTVHASQLDYVEAHGTGTRAGDPVELGALATVLSEGRAADAPRTWVGSVKTNIGHTEAAAGVAGLIKAALMLQHRQIPPSLHFSTPNADVAWDTIPLAIPTALIPWPARDGPVFAGISSYGIGGTNAHVVLESAPAVVPAGAARRALPTAMPAVLPISARSKAGLRAVAAQYATLLDDPTAELHDICAAAATRRSALTHRAAFVASDHESLVTALRAFGAGEPATADGVVHDNARRKVAFVVPGQGAQWVGMAREFAAASPVFRGALDECDAAARAHISWSIVEQLHLDATSHGWMGDRIEVIQPTLIALAIAYAAWLRSVGIEPDAVVGHSLGEVGAACIAGAIDIPTAMRIICRRSALMQRTSGQGAMAVVELSQAAATARLAGYESRVSVAVNNGPRSSVISGDPQAVQELLAALERDGVFGRMVKVDVASHSPQMEPLVSELVTSLTGIHTAAATIPIYSTVNGARIDGTELGAAYWGRNLRQPVQFGAAVQQMLDEGITAFIELGPHPVLTQVVQQVAQAAGRDAATITVACGRRDTSDLATVLTAVASLWTRGVAIDWRRVIPSHRTHVQLPFYPWQRERFWVEAGDLAPPNAMPAPRRARLDADARAALYTQAWHALPETPVNGTRDVRRWLVIGERGTDGDALASALRARGDEASVAGSMHEACAQLLSWPPGDRQIGVVVLPVHDDAIAYAPVSHLQTLQSAVGAASPRDASRVWWLTRGAHAVAGHAPAGRCAPRAAAWGAARVLAEEHPQWWGGLLDLAADADITSQATAIAAHLTARDGEDQVALRDDVRYGLRLVPAPEATPAPYAWRTDAAYLITGGLGGVSLAMADTMVRDGARRLVLLGRTPLPPRSEWSTLDATSVAGRRAAAVRALEHAGASVHLLSADVADEASVRAALATYTSDGWPDIAGVVHNAAVLDARLSGDMTPEAFARALGPKLIGAEVLDRVFPDVELFVLSSSISAWLAPSGMSSYSAANAGVDAVAAARRARGRHGISVQWPPWENVGMHEDSRMSRNVVEMQLGGIAAITAPQGAAYFAAATGRADSTLTVLPVNWSAFGRARRGRSSTLFRAIPSAAASESEASPEDLLLLAALAASPLERRAHVESIVRTTLAGILRRAATALDARQPFGAMGVDSLMALEFRNRLESALQRPLSATLTWNYPTVDALTSHLDALLTPVAAPAELVPQPAFDVEPASAALLFADIAELSDDDALRALRRGR